MDETNRSVVLERKKPRRGFVVRFLRDFTTNSSLHGLKYVGETSRSTSERIFWLTMFVLSVVTCGYLIINLWQRWMQNPVIVSFGEKLVPVWQAPFPAVTICPRNRVPLGKYNYSDQLRKYENNSELPEFEKAKFEDITMLCPEVIDYFDYFPKFGNQSTVEHLLSVSISANTSFFECLWHDETCVFSRVLANRRICYTFNSLSDAEMLKPENIQNEYVYSEEKKMSNGWTLENGYSEDAPIAESYPRRGRDFGSTADLFITLLDKDSNYDPICDGSLRGYEVLLHNPAEKPYFHRQHFLVHSGHTMHVGVTLNSMSSSDNLRNYDPMSRQCYFPTERHLTYFKVYTQRNCEMECSANFTYAMCGCVPYYMPYAVAKKVIGENKKNYRFFEEAVSANDTEARLNGIAKRCQCLPTCTTVTYDSDRSSSVADNEAVLKSYLIHYELHYVNNISFNRYMKGKFTDIKIYFKDSEFISVRRSELYGPTNFLANCGGLLGLFLGFSVLSLVEIFYYLTFRLWSLIRSTRSSAAGMDKQTNGADLHIA